MPLKIHTRKTAVRKFLMGLNILVPLLFAATVIADPEVAWNITGCFHNPTPCREGVADTRECEVVCFEDRTCEIRVALIFPNDTGYIVNLEAVISCSSCECVVLNVKLFGLSVGTQFSFFPVLHG